MELFRFVAGTTFKKKGTLDWFFESKEFRLSGKNEIEALKVWRRFKVSLCKLWTNRFLTQMRWCRKTDFLFRNLGAYLGKISAQPHTIVKQICFPNGNVLFLSLFSLSKNWMHNVGWGCAEILPELVFSARNYIWRWYKITSENLKIRDCSIDGKFSHETIEISRNIFHIS